MNYRFAILLAVVLLRVPVAIAQGILPFSTQVGGPVTSIDLATSNIVLRIPVRNKIGKIPFSYSLVANSAPTGDVSGPITLAGQLSGSGQVHYSLITKVPCGTGDTYIYGNFYYTDVTGASHSFGNGTASVGPTPSCYGGFDATSTDGTGYTLIASGGTSYVTATVYDKAGNSVGNGSITDPDGASITLNGSSYKDTLDQTALTITTNNGPPITNTYSYTDASNNPQKYTVTYSSLNIVYDLCGFAQGEPTPLSYPTSVTTPAGTYTLSYTVPQGYGNTYTDGRIAKIMLPSGGYESFTYAGGTNGEQCSSQVVPTLTHTISDNNGNTSTWTYVNSNTNGATSCEEGGGSCNFTVTETDPAGNQTVYSFAGEYQTQAKYYQGSATGIPSLPVTETDVYTSFNGGSSNRFIATYDTTYGNLTANLVYDFGASTLLSQTLFVYGKSYSSPTTCNAYPSGS
jgi:hypothetical protein